MTVSATVKEIKEACGEGELSGGYDDYFHSRKVIRNEPEGGASSSFRLVAFACRSDVQTGGDI